MTKGLGVPPALRAEEERAELAAMVERLARSPRLANLLRYLGDKYLNGESDQIREYNIATEVFGRPETFDSGQDAIARVEAHRLRKKLKEYYQDEGKDHKIQIVLPPGTYVPVFVQHRTPPPVEGVPLRLPLEQRRSPRLTAVLVAACLLLLAGVLALNHFAPNQKKRADEAPSSTAPLPAAFTSDAIRVLAGYSGQSRISASGVVWGADKYFQGGRPDAGARNFVARTSDPFLFQTCRSGEFSYAVPVRPGVYEVHLYFVETSYGPGLGGGENDRTFAVDINGERALELFDIESDAMGPNIADERVFKNIQPAKDGQIHIALESRRGEPILNALEIIPGLPNKQLPIRIVAQPSSFIDRRGLLWGPDDYYLGGQPSIRRPPVTDPFDPGLYAMERFGHFSYALPVAMNGAYTLVLHFAEFYFGPKASGVGGLGNRRFNLMCNGLQLLDDFDIFREAGSLSGVTKTFHHLRPSPQGKLNLLFEPLANYATVSAIEVLDESEIAKR